MPRAGSFRSLELDGPGVILLGLGNERLGFLLVVQGLEDLVGLFALVPPDVVGVLGVFVVMPIGGVAVEDGPAECRSLQAVTIGAQGIVPAGQHPLERLVGSRLAKDGHVVGVKAARVVVHLLHESFVTVLAAKSLHDLLAKGLLLHVQVADRRLDDLPVVLDHRPQRVVEREANLLALGLG